jgi:hypothetical protein
VCGVGGVGVGVGGGGGGGEGGEGAAKLDSHTKGPTLKLILPLRQTFQSGVIFLLR